MRRSVLAAVLGLAVCAAPAQALEPPPQIFTWDAFPAPGVTVDDQSLCSPGITAAAAETAALAPPSQVPTGGFDGGPYLQAFCSFGGSMRIIVDFAAPQALVVMYVRSNGSNDITVVACGPDPICRGNTVTRTTSPGARPWSAVVLRDRMGVNIRHIEIETAAVLLALDDLGASTSVAQPDTEIASGPAATTTARDAAFNVRANQPGVTFTCTLDGAPSPCDRVSQLALGSHTFTAVARDRWGLVDQTPATHSWTVVSPAPPDADLDGVLDAADNCPTSANANQSDADGDGIGDA